jgi:serine/threonine protein kinase/WD40 repeat protein
LLTEKPGGRIGPYKLLEQIGEGGCGVVFVAEQERPVRRRVALKVIKVGMDTRQVVARFEAERQALALMDHPHIAKVLDAGTTEEGRPFFVMELVKGIPITRYCDENRLETKERLKLFIDVCLAIQHAHQKGIIHRDIKPSNILVADHDGVPVPKVIDFGIAKATTNQRLTDKTLYTAIEQFIGTPAYMSPEQAKLSGLDIDTRSDIYSLGVLVYELLTGRTPFDSTRLVEAGLDEIRRIIREEDPPRPSTRLSTLDAAEQTAVATRRHSEPPKLLGLIRGDLDWIVMKTLEKDRNRRYETANGLATDVQRFLRYEPIVARPPSKLYRLRKLVRRNKVVFAVATVATVALAVAAVVAFWMAVRANEGRREATESAAQAASQKQLAERRLYDSLIGQARATRLARGVGYRDEVFRLLKRARELGVPQKSASDLQREADACLGDFVGLQPMVLTNFPAKTTIFRGVAGSGVGPPAFLLSDGTILVYDLVENTSGARLTAEDPAGDLWLDSTGDQLVSLHSPKLKDALERLNRTTLCTWKRQAGTQWKLVETAPAPGTVRILGTDHGPVLAVSDHNGELSIVRLDSRAVMARIPRSPSGMDLRPMAISWDSGVLALAHKSEVELWDLRTGDILRRIKPGFQSWIFEVALSFDGKYLACLSLGESALYDASGERLATEKEYVDIFSGLAFIGNGATLALPLRFQGRVRLWDGVSGHVSPALRVSGEVLKTAVSPDGSHVLAYGWQQGWLFRLRVPEKMSLPIHPGSVPGMCFSPDGTRLATVCKDGWLRAWGAADGKLAWKSGPLASQGQSVSYSEDGRFLATTTWGYCSVCLWDAHTGERLLELPGSEPGGIIWEARFAAGCKYIVAAGNRGLSLWSLHLADSAKPAARFLQTLEGDTWDATFLTDNNIVFARTISRGLCSLFRWQFNSGAPPLLLSTNLICGPHALSFGSRCDRVLGIASAKGLVVLDSGTGRELLSLPFLTPGERKQGAAEQTVELSPDGSKMAVTSPSRLGFTIHDATTGVPLYFLAEQDSWIESFSWSADNQRLAVSRDDGAVEIWSLREMAKAGMD